METILLQAETGLILDALIDKGVAFLIMGIVIWWLAKRLEKAENDKSDLAKDVIKLTVAYENKLDNDKIADSEIKNLLHEIRDSIRNWRS